MLPATYFSTESHYLEDPKVHLKCNAHTVKPMYHQPLGPVESDNISRIIVYPGDPS